VTVAAKTKPKSLPEKWRRLLDKLYAPTCERIDDLIPQLVDAIRALPPKHGNAFLSGVLLSPAARAPRLTAPLNFLEGMKAGVAALDPILDAAGLPRDQSRDEWRLEVRRRRLDIHQSGKAFDLRKFVDSLASEIGPPGDEATKTRMQRARAAMGISRPRGRQPANRQKLPT
jgi:hypothetical protein